MNLNLFDLTDEELSNLITTTAKEFNSLVSTAVNRHLKVDVTVGLFYKLRGHKDTPCVVVEISKSLSKVEDNEPKSL